MSASAQKMGRDRRGFTLIEVLMALLILTVGLLGLLQSVNIAYEHNLRKRLRDEAVAIAEEQLNEMRRKPLTAEERAHPVLISSVTVNQPVAGATKEFTVSRESQSLGTSSRKLTVSVRWSFKNMTAVHEIYTIKRL